MDTTMSLKHSMLILILTVIFSSFPLLCRSSYPLPDQHDLQKYPTKTFSNSLNEHEDKAGSYHAHGLQNIVNYNKVDHAKSRALAPSPPPPRVVNVDHYLHRKMRDHTRGFRKAWKEACSSKAGVFLVPKNKKYKVRPIKFSGPCHPNLRIKILGKIEASVNVADYKNRLYWLVFENLRNFKVEGGGTIDGNGKIWWQNSCKINKTKPCQHAPTAVSFIGCKNFIVDGLRLINAQQMHLTFQKSTDVRASNLIVKSPQSSPNTDGIHVTETRNIQITRSVIKTGDDCISIVSGSKNVQATEIICGPGHGISIGSLGKGHSEAHVSNVLVNRARLSGTTNGVRIKTWQGGRGYATNIIFQDIVMQNVTNPIIIDQHYCDQETPCQDMKSAVHVNNIVYRNIKGTSATEVAIKLDCSKSHQCDGIVLQNINLVKEGAKEATADCQNVSLVRRGKVTPRCSQEM